QTLARERLRVRNALLRPRARAEERIELRRYVRLALKLAVRGATLDEDRFELDVERRRLRVAIVPHEHGTSARPEDARRLATSRFEVEPVERLCRRDEIDARAGQRRRLRARGDAVKARLAPELLPGDL